MSYGRDSFEDLTYNSGTDSYDPATGYGRNQQLDLVYNPETEEYERVYPDYCTLTLDVIPADATISFSTGVVEGNQCTVPSGTTVTYVVSKQWYNTVTESVTLIQHQTVSINLIPKQGTLTVNTTPEDAIVTFSTGTASGHTCTVDAGTYVTYTVSKLGYVSSSDTVFVDDTDIEVDVEIDKALYTITIVPAPQDSTVVITADGYTQVDNSITVEYGVLVSYTVSHEGYYTKSSSLTAFSDKVINVNLKPDTTIFYTITIEPYPNIATVQLIAPGFTQVGNSITVPSHTLVNCVVSAENYKTEHRYISVVRDASYPITLELMPIPANQIRFDNTVPCYIGQSVAYWVSKEHFIPVTGSMGRITGPKTVTVPLMGENLEGVQYGEVVKSPRVDNKKVTGTVTEGSDLGSTRVLDEAFIEVVTNPSDANVVITCNNAVQEGNSILVTLGSQIFWKITRDHYIAVSGNMYVVGDQRIFIDLEPIMHLVTVSSVEGSEVIIKQNGVVVAAGHETAYVKLAETSQFVISVTADGYEPYESEPITVTGPMNISVPLTPVQAMFSVQCTTPGVVISFNGEPVIGNAIQAPVGATVTWEASATGYQSESGTHIMSLSDTSVTVDLDKLQCTYTLQPNVAEYTANFTVVSGQEISRTSDSITVEYGSVINWIVNAQDYVSSIGTNITVTEDTTQEVELEPALL